MIHQAGIQFFHQWLARFQAVDTNGFSEQEKLSAQLMIRSQKDRIDGIDPLDRSPVLFEGLALLAGAPAYRRSAERERSEPACSAAAGYALIQLTASNI